MKTKKNIWIILAIIAVVAASRLFIRDIPNFSPIYAIAFMGGALFQNKWFKFLLPLGILALSDLALNTFIYPEYTNGSILYEGMIWVYLPFVLCVMLGQKLLKKLTVGKVVLTGFATGVLFFLLSNFGVWMSGTMYPQTGAGLIMAYEEGIPFFRNTLGSSIAYGLLIYFAAYFAINPVQKKSIA